MPAAEPEGFHQLALRLSDPIQHDHEIIRNVVNFAAPVAQRPARRFDEGGMLGLVDQRATRAGRKPHPFPGRRGRLPASSAMGSPGWWTSAPHPANQLTLPL